MDWCIIEWMMPIVRFQSLFTHTDAIPNLYGHLNCPWMEKNCKKFHLFFSLCVLWKKNTVYSLGVTAGWINNDNEINFGWIIPVKACISIMTAGMLPFFAAYLIHINVWRKRLILAGGELGKREKKKPNTIVSFEN